MLDPIRSLLAGALAAAGSVESHIAAADPDALWRIVHGHCVVEEMKANNPAPCTQVDLPGGSQERGFAVLKDLVGKTQYLLIPTRKVTGIESPEILAPHAPNYFQDAWAARQYVVTAAAAPLTRDDIGLAMNSRYARSQNQLHIHIDCVKPDVKQALHLHAGEIGVRWAPLATRLAGGRYVVRRLSGDELGNSDPVRLLAEGAPGARRHMDEETLAVIGATFDGKPGFYLLSDRANLKTGHRAGSEQLLDHACALARPAS